MILQHVNDIASVCAGHGVKTAIISPGSRSAPLTLAFTRHPEIETRVIPDERSAAFIAMGIAQQQGVPVVLVCTSGSAAYNYAPAIAEAFYQEIPLLVLTADRPPEWVNQYDGQTIQQSDIYGKHVKKSANFPVDVNHKDAVWQCNRIVNESLLAAQSEPRGPVHINIPFREPFYPEAEEQIDFPEVRIISNSTPDSKVGDSEMAALISEWSQFNRVAIVPGQHDYSAKLSTALDSFSREMNIPVIADIISNQHDISGSIQHQDAFLGKQRPDAPELLITFGLSLISKNLKLYLRANPPKAHWHISPSDRLNDSLQNLTRLVKMSPENFFEQFKPDAKREDFRNEWQALDKSTHQHTNAFLDNADFGEFKAVQKVMQNLPEKSQLHLANSMAVRYANLLGLRQGHDIAVFANRGTSGIDGSNSTAVGAALAQEQMVTLITGDMAFFYDRNAFWHNYDLPNLRIVILNNHAGGIFRLIKGPSSQPELDEYFETRQALTARNTCDDFGFEYLRSDNQDDLEKMLENFYSESNNAKVLEVDSNSELNASIFEKFKQMLSSLPKG